jgi:hypothetical protein
MTFNSWLRKQRHRNDNVGDLAQDYIDDCRFNKIPSRSIESLRARAPEDAIEDALEEYRLARELAKLMES